MKSHPVIARAVSVAAILAAVSTTGGAQVTQLSVTPKDPEVSVNIRNENIPAKRTIDFTATPGSYVTVIRVTPVGGVEVLFPSMAVVDRAMVPTSKRVPVPKTPTQANPQGVGSIYAFVSARPYVFSKVADGNGWNSLHLTNYAAATDAAIAESFGNEIAAPGSRVLMSKATTAPVAIISHDHRPLMASLASFRAKQCPTLSAQANGATPNISCVMKGVPYPNPLDAKPMQTQAQPQSQPTGTSK